MCTVFLAFLKGYGHWRQSSGKDSRLLKFYVKIVSKYCFVYSLYICSPSFDFSF